MTAAADNWYDGTVSTFGDRLTAAREAAGLDQAELAKRVGVKLSSLRKWEDDLLEPRANRLSMLAGMLNVSITWLIDGVGDGLSVPLEDDTKIEDEARQLLAEMSELRAELKARSDQVARLEKRLRRHLTEHALA
jgi:transcriptional regulator with XRE-family HTH domain